MRMMRTKDRLFLLLVSAFFLLFPVFTTAQERRYDYDELLNCERNLLYQDFVINAALEKAKENGVLIVIVRLGDGETSRELIRYRLYNLRLYFKERGSRLASEKIIFAEGERVKGYGRVEYYLDGKLYERLLFPENGYICHSCCGYDHNYYPEKEIDERRQKQKQKKKRRG
jgi:hypothetical protein